MRAVEFEEQTGVIAEDQDEYFNLPYYAVPNPQGVIIVCWKLTWKERIRILFTGKVWHEVWTFGNSLQPIRLTIDKPEMPNYEEENRK